MGQVVSLPVQEIARRELATRKIKYFCQYVYNDFVLFPFTELMCDTVDLVVDGIIDRLIINVPPQRGKSTIVSKSLPGFNLGKFPNDRVVLSSYNASLAHRLSAAARDLIQTDRYKQLFGAISASENIIELSDETRSVANWRINGYDGGTLATGVGGGLTGHSADLVVIDDPVKDDVEVLQENFQEAQLQWYWSVVRTRLSARGRVILTQTRWHENDLTGKLLRQQNEVGEYWYVLRLPAKAETPEEIENWCALNGVREEFLITKKSVAALRAMPPHMRPHARGEDESTGSLRI